MPVDIGEGGGGRGKHWGEGEKGKREKVKIEKGKEFGQFYQCFLLVQVCLLASYSTVASRSWLHRWHLHDSRRQRPRSQDYSTSELAIGLETLTASKRVERHCQDNQFFANSSRCDNDGLLEDLCDNIFLLSE